MHGVSATLQCMPFFLKHALLCMALFLSFPSMPFILNAWSFCYTIMLSFLFQLYKYAFNFKCMVFRLHYTAWLLFGACFIIYPFLFELFKLYLSLLAFLKISYLLSCPIFMSFVSSFLNAWSGLSHPAFKIHDGVSYF